MESRGERAENYLNDAWEYVTGHGMTPEDFRRQRQAVQEDMAEALRLMVQWGEISQEEADQRQYDWMQRWCPDIEGRDV